MPVRSKSQNRMMQAAAHDPMIAKKVGVPVSVAQKYAKETKTTKGLPEKVKAKGKKR